MAMMGYDEDAMRISERLLRRAGGVVASRTRRRRELAICRMRSRALLGDENWRKWLTGLTADGGAAAMAMSGRNFWKLRRMGEEWLWERKKFWARGCGIVTGHSSLPM
jgi:hypothetical protein